jgi:membrane-associated protease RseP (regulator of RpoE activity)
MNVNRVRSLLLVVNVGLAAGTGYTVYREFESKEERRNDALRFQGRLLEDLKNTPAATRRETVRVSIKESDFVDLTGAKPKPLEVRPVESAPTSRAVTPLETMIKVVTISHHADPTIANVAILRKADVQPTAERSIFRVGDTIPFANDAVVLEIHPKEVVFQNGDQVEKLRVPDQLTQTPGGATGTGSGPADPGNRAFSTYVESKKDSGIVTIKSGGTVALEREGENVLQGVVFSTTETAGGGKALRIDTVPAGSLLAQHGVQSGDVLISVDGVPMSTKSEVVAYAKRNKNKPVFDVVFQRRGRNHNKRVVIDR